MREIIIVVIGIIFLIAFWEFFLIVGIIGGIGFGIYQLGKSSAKDEDDTPEIPEQAQGLTSIPPPGYQQDPAMNPNPSQWVDPTFSNPGTTPTPGAVPPIPGYTGDIPFNQVPGTGTPPVPGPYSAPNPNDPSQFPYNPSHGQTPGTTPGPYNQGPYGTVNPNDPMKKHEDSPYPYPYDQYGNPYLP